MALNKISLFVGALLLVFTTSSAILPKESIHKLEGSHAGQTVPGLHELKEYLTKFGYLDHSSQRDDVFDRVFESAIKMFQKNYGLRITGRLDADTLNQMMKPRCGMLDVVIVNNKGMQRDRKLKWLASKSHFTYKLPSNASSVSGVENMREVFARAFRRWARVSHLTFQEMTDDYDDSSACADIEIEFHRGAHGDAESFDGPYGVLAHVSDSGMGRVRIHFDADEKWNTKMRPSANEMDLESVAMHEIGDLLGLEHSFIPNAVMFPCFEKGTTKRNLQEDDVKKMLALHGLI